MIAERIRKCIAAEPFQPFAIAMHEGRVIPVADQDLIVVSPEGSRTVVFQPNDRFDILDCRYITELIPDDANS